MTILVIDVGNSRMKWGLHGSRGWLALGVTPNGEIGTLALRDWHNLPRPVRAVGVNVAGEAARVRVEAQLARWRLVAGVADRARRPRAASPTAMRGLRSSAPTAGRRSSRRGARRRDRALSAGLRRRQRRHGGDRSTRSTSTACSAAGSSCPGMRLMLQALAENTAALKVRAGRRSANFPTTRPTRSTPARCRRSAARSSRCARRIDTDPAQVRVYLAGGAAPEIAPHLNPPVEVVDNLVLEGVLALAGVPAAGNIRALTRPAPDRFVMRTVVILLLLANLTLFGYTWLDSASGGEGVRLQQQVQPDKIKLLTAAAGRGARPREGRRARRRLRRMGTVVRCRPRACARRPRAARARQAADRSGASRSTTGVLGLPAAVRDQGRGRQARRRAEGGGRRRTCSSSTAARSATRSRSACSAPRRRANAHLADLARQGVTGAKSGPRPAGGRADGARRPRSAAAGHGAAARARSRVSRQPTSRSAAATSRR